MVGEYFLHFSSVLKCPECCSTWLRLLHLHYDIVVMWLKKIKHAISTFYTQTKHGFLTNQSMHIALSIL